MRRELQTGLSGDVPVVLSQWYDTTKWILEKVDRFPKNQPCRVRPAAPRSLTTQKNLKSLMDVPWKWINRVGQRRPLDKLILDLDSSLSETYGRRERDRQADVLGRPGPRLSA